VETSTPHEAATEEARVQQEPTRPRRPRIVDEGEQKNRVAAVGMWGRTSVFFRAFASPAGQKKDREILILNFDLGTVLGELLICF
jgi:hypothetical protein